MHLDKKPLLRGALAGALLGSFYSLPFLLLLSWSGRLSYAEGSLPFTQGWFIPIIMPIVVSAVLGAIAATILPKLSFGKIINAILLTLAVVFAGSLLFVLVYAASWYAVSFISGQDYSSMPFTVDGGIQHGVLFGGMVALAVCAVESGWVGLKSRFLKNSLNAALGLLAGILPTVFLTLVYYFLFSAGTQFFWAVFFTYAVFWYFAVVPFIAIGLFVPALFGILYAVFIRLLRLEE